MGDELITLKVDAKELALISSLLQQPRRIEHTLRNRIFVIDHDWCRNLIAICQQRMAQHDYSVYSFSADIYYENGRVDKISTREGFDAYVDNQQRLSVGVDMSMSFLVSFGGSNEPEKQDIRVQAFSDESYKFFLKRKRKSLDGSIISSSISSSNPTWAEDMEGHVSRHIDGTLRTSLLSRLLFYLDDNGSAIVSVSGPLVIVISFVSIATLGNLPKEFDALETDSSLDAISRKINIIIEQYNRIPHSAWLFVSAAFVVVLLMILRLFSDSLIRRFCRPFVIFNNHSKTIADRHFSKNEWLTRLLFGLLAGIPVALLTAYIKGLFPF